MAGTSLRVLAAALVALAAALHPAAAQEDSAAIQEVRDRAAIHLLLLDYGRTLDERDFAGFGALFTADAEYGPQGAMAIGPQAVAERMRAAFAGNSLGFADPNFHVFFNEQIEIAGERAEATSMSFYVVPGEDGQPRIAMMARYRDNLVRVGDDWKFRRRLVESLLPAPQAAPR
jgi:hypothetical protein